MIPVPYFDYLNVRIRGYHSHLFTRDTCEDLLGGDNLGGLTTFLLDQPTYREDIEKALEGQPERKGLERGVTDYFARRISNVLHMAHEKARHLLRQPPSAVRLSRIILYLYCIPYGTNFSGRRTSSCAALCLPEYYKGGR